MAFKTSTSTDYIDFLNDLIDFATTEEALSAVPAAGGTGYTVSDQLTVSGGTFGTAAVFNVDSVGGSNAVTGVSLVTAGDYTATPTNPAATTGGTGSACTLTVTYTPAYGWELQRESQEVASSAVTAGGTGYTVSDQLSLVGGNGDVVAVLNVDSVGGSNAVTAVSVVTAGNYWELPSSPVSVTGGSGTLCTLTPVWTRVTAQDKEAVLKGSGGGSDEIFIGIRTFTDSSARNFELAGFTGYTAALSWENQPGISPGRYDGISPLEEGAYVPLSNSSITYWLAVDAYRIAFSARIGSTYIPGYLGWGDRFGTAAEYPYPLLIMGASADPSRLFSDTSAGFSGMTDPHNYQVGEGPGFIRLPGGTWHSVQNSFEQFTARNRATDIVVYPCNYPDATVLPAPDRPFRTSFVSTDFCPATGHPGVATAELLPTPGSPDETVIFPATVCESRSGTEFRILISMRGVFWANALTVGGSLVTEDDITIGGTVYRFLQNCNRSDHFAHFCIEQA